MRNSDVERKLENVINVYLHLAQRFAVVYV